MIIKVLFAIFVLSAAALVGAVFAAFVRVWWHLKAQRKQAQDVAETAPESSSGEQSKGA